MEPTLFRCQRADLIAALGGWTGDFVQKIACNALILHFLISCQAKQGAVVDVLWNQQRCGSS